jgi:hypothetical protein
MSFIFYNNLNGTFIVYLYVFVYLIHLYNFILLELDVNFLWSCENLICKASHLN